MIFCVILTDDYRRGRNHQSTRKAGNWEGIPPLPRGPLGCLQGIPISNMISGTNGATTSWHLGENADDARLRSRFSQQWVVRKQQHVRKSFRMMFFHGFIWSSVLEQQVSGEFFLGKRSQQKGSGFVIKDMVHNDFSGCPFQIQNKQSFWYHFGEFSIQQETNPPFDLGVHFRWSAEDAENNCIFRYDLLGAQAEFFGQVRVLRCTWVCLAIDPPLKWQRTTSCRSWHVK